ncbi:MAG: tetratricopeptide repeat protein [Actinomycetes bacterium]
MSSLPKNFGSAFDLSALKNPVSAAELSGISITQANLMQDVLPASHAQVVILICWSARSAQSQSVMAALGKMHEDDSARPEGAGWLLGNVNVDIEPEVAQALQVQTVPLALAIIQEQVVPLFETVPTVPQLRLVVDKVLSLAAERGVGSVIAEPEGAVEEKLEPEEIKALEALESGDFAGAKAAYREWLNRSPSNPLALLGFAQVELLHRIDGLDSAAIISQANLRPADIALAQQAADCEIAQGNFDASFARLIAAVKLASGDERKALREHLVGLFALVDPADPILIRARQQLASALF